MEKVIVTLWRPAAVPADALGALLANTIPALSVTGPVLGARVLVEAPEAAHLRYGGPVEDHVFCGLVSLWLASYQDLDEVSPLLDSPAIGRRHSYLVTESVVRPRTDGAPPPLGEPAPGLCQATLFDKAASANEEEFFHVWHTLHRTTTLDLHPVCMYVRNEVVRALSPEAPPLRGIVYESTATAEEMLDPHRFFGSGGDDEVLRRNIEHVMAETAQFLDYDTIQTAVMRDYLVRRVST